MNFLSKIPERVRDNYRQRPNARRGPASAWNVYVPIPEIKVNRPEGMDQEELEHFVKELEPNFTIWANDPRNIIIYRKHVL